MVGGGVVNEFNLLTLNSNGFFVSYQIFLILHSLQFIIVLWAGLQTHTTTPYSILNLTQK